MRSSLIPLIAAALLVGLVLLLPSREEAASLGDLNLPLQPLDLYEPPAWAVDSATDEIERNLDRLHWAGHVALSESRRSLRRHRGSLSEEVLARLQILGSDEPVIVQKFLEVLGEEDLDGPGVLDEFIRRAYSPHGLVAKTALRVLARHPDDGATAGIFPRLQDDDLDVRSHARAALARRARSGDRQAQELVLEDLEQHPHAPDLAYLSVLDVMDSERTRATLEVVKDRAGEAAIFLALTVQLKLGVEVAREELEHMLLHGQPPTRINVLQAAVGAGKVVGQEHWRNLLLRAGRVEALALADLFLLAVDTGHEDADRAIILLEEMAAHGPGNAHMEVTDALFRREHPMAMDRTRQELQVEVGGRLSQVCDRVISAIRVDRSEFVALAAKRLSEPTHRSTDRLPLLRLLAHVAPEQAVEPVVETLLEAVRSDPEMFASTLPLLDRLGVAGVQALAAHAPSPDRDALLVYAAGKARSGLALPSLETVILAETTSPSLKVEALDAIVRLVDGPREEVLRRVIKGLSDPELTARARLLYWNYL